MQFKVTFIKIHLGIEKMNGILPNSHKDLLKREKEK